MGSFLDEIKNSKKQLEISRRLKMQAHIDWIKHDISTDIEKEKKVKEQYSILVRNLNSSIKIMGEKLQKELDKLDDYGRFPVSVIGPLIAKAMTEIEGQKFIYKEVNFREIYDYYDEEDFPRRGKVCIVTNRLDNFDISESYEDVGNFAKGGKTILLGTIGFDMGYYIYNGNKYEVQQIVDSDDKVAFYSPKYDIATKDYNYIDEYIDLLIERKVLNESYLDDLDGYSFEIRDYMNFRTELLEEKDYQELYDYIINKHKKSDKMSLKREKMTNEEIFNDSTFDIYRVGPSIARIVSILEEKNYVFKLADYHAVLWDWNEMYVCSEGSINETGYVLSREKEKHPTFAENICLSYTFDSPTDDDTICIGLNHFKHPYKNYPEIVDGKITFYNNANERQLDIIHQDAVYAFIDYLIDYKKTNNKDLKESEIANLLKNYLTILLENNISLKREKNV